FTSKKMKDIYEDLADNLINDKKFKEEKRLDIIIDMKRYITLGYPSDTIDKVNEYITSKKLGNDLKDYIKKRELFPYISTSYMIGAEVLPSEDSEVNHNS